MGWDGSRWVGCPGDQVGGLRDHWHWQGRGSGLWRVNLYLDEGQSTRKYIHTSDSQLQPPAQDTRPPSAGTSPGGGCALCLRPASDLPLSTGTARRTGGALATTRGRAALADPLPLPHGLHHHPDTPCGKEPSARGNPLKGRRTHHTGGSPVLPVRLMGPAMHTPPSQ